MCYLIWSPVYGPWVALVLGVVLELSRMPLSVFVCGGEDCVCVCVWPTTKIPSASINDIYNRGNPAADSCCFLESRTHAVINSGMLLFASERVPLSFL